MYATTFDAGSVCDCHVPADRNGRRVFEELQHGAAQRIRLEHRISVDDEHQFAGRGVDPGVGRICFAPGAVLVDHHQRRLCHRSEDTSNRRRFERLLERHRRGDELKRLLEA
jgi:hypothetical protein